MFKTLFQNQGCNYDNNMSGDESDEIKYYM